jgi:hypothetical protein
LIVLILIGVAIWYFATQGDEGDGTTTPTPAVTGPTATTSVSVSPTG